MYHILFNLSGVLCIVAVRIELAIILPFQTLALFALNVLPLLLIKFIHPICSHRFTFCSFSHKLSVLEMDFHYYF